MKSIATLTMNPTIDVSYEVDRVFHTHKMRTRNERYDPGGGGINVARVFCRLGGDALSFYLSGGPTGVALDGLVDALGLTSARIPIAAPTRVASAASPSCSTPRARRSRGRWRRTASTWSSPARANCGKSPDATCNRWTISPRPPWR